MRLYPFIAGVTRLTRAQALVEGAHAVASAARQKERATLVRLHTDARGCRIGGFSRAAASALYRGVARHAGSLLHYGITQTDSTKTDVTMRFLVENYPKEVISLLFFSATLCPLHKLS